MADFKKFWPLLEKHEGLWANDPSDKGGPTWKGISYNNYPSWSGWAIIEAAIPEFKKAKKDQVNPILKGNVALNEKVIEFYKRTQWDVVLADSIENQSIANFICDFGVNTGFSVPIKKAQAILGVVADGKFGPKTLAALNAADGATFFGKLQEARREYYRAIVRNNPSQAKFLNTWLSRTNSFKYIA